MSGLTVSDRALDRTNIEKIEVRPPDRDNFNAGPQRAALDQAGDDLAFATGDEKLHAAPLCWPSRSPA